MSERVVHRVSRKRHRCATPGWWRRRKLDLDYGSVWECDCGRRWMWDWNYAGAFWTPRLAAAPEQTP